jgi:hypothetical protein
MPGSGISTSSIGAGKVDRLAVKGFDFRMDPWRALILEIATFSWSLRERVFDLEIPSIRPLASLLPCSAAYIRVNIYGQGHISVYAITLAYQR